MSTRFAFKAVVFLSCLTAAAAGLLCAVSAGADIPATSKPVPAEAARTSPSGPLEGTVEKAAVTYHDITLDGRRLHYRAVAANMPMKDENGKLKARVFFVGYEETSPPDPPATRESGAADAAATQPACRQPERRPITFVFNGGPGAAAVWLHLGAAGPRRIVLSEDGEPLPPPYRLEENPHCWLGATDLVFIDPVGTGFSRPAEGEKGEQFYGVREDITWVADFIRLYVTQYQRWLSPKFLAGESYGTTRAAGLSDHLLDRYGLALNGIVLISSVLDFQTLVAGGANDLPYVLYLPTYTAIAWHHRKLPPDLQEDQARAMREAREWALGTYSVALARGLALPEDQRQAVIAALARYSGLPADFIARSDLRIPPSAFQKQLLLSERRIIGRFDGRITGYDPDPAATRPFYDPSLPRYFAAYSSTFNDYVRRTLKYESVLPYEVLSDKVHPWKMGEPGHGFLSVLHDLQTALVANPDLKVLFASGYYDLATPYAATDFTIGRLDVGPAARRNITHTLYAGGHMMYHHRLSQAKLKTDVADFIRSAVPADMKTPTPAP